MATVAERRLTFAAPGSVDLQAERMAASTRALEEFDLVGIKSGAVAALIKAAAELTAWTDMFIEWHQEHPGSACSKADPGNPGTGGGSPCSRRQLLRLTEASRRVLDARAALKSAG